MHRAQWDMGIEWDTESRVNKHRTGSTNSYESQHDRDCILEHATRRICQWPCHRPWWCHIMVLLVKPLPGEHRARGTQSHLCPDLAPFPRTLLRRQQALAQVVGPCHLCEEPRGNSWLLAPTAWPALAAVGMWGVNGSSLSLPLSL